MGKRRPGGLELGGLACVFAALGSPTRFRLLLRLVERPYTVNELAAAVGARQANVSKQLNILKRAPLVRPHRAGTTVTYSADSPEVNRMIRLASALYHNISSSPVFIM